MLSDACCIQHNISEHNCNVCICTYSLHSCLFVIFGLRLFEKGVIYIFHLCVFVRFGGFYYFVFGIFLLREWQNMYTFVERNNIDLGLACFRGCKFGNWCLMAYSFLNLSMFSVSLKINRFTTKRCSNLWA